MACNWQAGHSLPTSTRALRRLWPGSTAVVVAAEVEAAVVVEVVVAVEVVVGDGPSVLCSSSSHLHTATRLMR